MRLELLTSDIPLFFPFLENVLQDGGAKLYSIDGAIKTIKNIEGYSGYQYEQENFQGILAIGMILGGTGYVLKRVLKNKDQELVRFDYFNNKGEFTFSSEDEALKVIYVDNYDMDLSCPILNHFYNFLSLEYANAAEGKSNTEQVHSVENLLISISRSKLVQLPIKKGVEDSAIELMYQKILKAELDPVLTWEERQLVFANQRVILKKILFTKARAHKISKKKLEFNLIFKNISNFFQRVISRPVDNITGLLYRYTIGKILWFFQTVKNNLGYSIALAVYGPFTYYFITMPMNPHAMQAVGRVRATYLEIKEEISELINKNEVATVKNSFIPISTPTSETTKTDSISTKNAAPSKTITDNAALANVIFPSSVTTGQLGPVEVNLGDGIKEKHQASLLNLLISTDIEKVNNQTWIERMSHFKQMQIAYEENIEYASRMGRLEQLETQYNFPMQVETTWEELEKYNNLIFKIRQENPNLSAKMKQYLFNEINRTQQLELYLWDRLARFILDQPYVMLDQDKEQKRNDYYVGRSFVFMQEMTNILTWRYKNFKKPQGFERIEKLADFYEKSRKEYGTVLKNLAANSDLFKQRNVYDTKEFRSYMKRQWEILYLQNSKAEEAANMGLNMYIWSVRNTVWILQSLYSLKRDELALLIKRDVTGQLFSPAEMLARSKTSMLYETLFHNLTLEYVGIREEIMNRLGKDIESTQRMTVLNNLKEFLSDRDKLDGLGMANSQQTAGTNL
ncbi:MAG: hypothetical protein AB7I27_00680 [Bacteriovoracaceae bacterium]